MLEERVARRYAKALVLLASDTDKQSSFMTQLKIFADALENAQSPLRRLVENPAFTLEERKQVLTALCEESKAPQMIGRLLMLLAERDKLKYVPAIYRSFVTELDVKMGRVRAVISSSSELSKTYVEQIVQALKTRLGKEVLAQTTQDPALHAGVKAKIGGLVFDNTLETQMKNLERELEVTSW